MIVESNGGGMHATCHIPIPMHGHSISPESEKVRRSRIYPPDPLITVGWSVMMNGLFYETLE